LQNETKRFDAMVIGAGAGGMAAATRLSLAGKSTLLVESLDRVGGRASTRVVEGFRLNTGAIAIELDGPIPQLVKDAAGVEIDFYQPQRDTVLLWGKREFNVSAGPLGTLRENFGSIIRTATAIPILRPKPGQSTTDWLRRFTKHKAIHSLVDNVLGGFFAATGRDVAADTFIRYLADGSGFKNLGFPRGGTIEVWNPLAEAIESRGGEVWLRSEVTALQFGADGQVTGAEIDRDGTTIEIQTDIVVSNAGPLNTVRLAGAENFPEGYAAEVEKKTDGAAIITVHFASKTPLVNWPMIALVGKSRRMTYAGNFSAPEQRQTKPGWFLYSAASTPRPARGPFDLDAEKQLLLDDVREYFPGFDRYATVLKWDITAHEWPAQRAVTGYDLPIDTPIPNLWNVGDGVKIGADAGTAACVRTADAVVERILAQNQ
jgi:phytoene desaturase